MASTQRNVTLHLNAGGWGGLERREMQDAAGNLYEVVVAVSDVQPLTVSQVAQTHAYAYQVPKRFVIGWLAVQVFRMQGEKITVAQSEKQPQANQDFHTEIRWNRKVLVLDHSNIEQSCLLRYIKR